MKFRLEKRLASSVLVCALLGGLVLSCSKGGGTQDNAGGGEGGGGGGAGEGGAQNEAGSNGGGETGGGGGAAAGGAGGMQTAGSGGTKSGGTGGVSSGGAGGMMNAGGAPNTGGTPVMPMSDCKAPACDGFESYSKGNRPAGAWSGFEVGAGAALAVDDGKAFSGTKSVKVTVTPGGDLKARMNRSGPAGSEVFVRLMLYVEKKITGQGVFHWNFTTVQGGDGTHVVSGGNAQGRTFQHYIGAGRDCYIHGSNPIPVGKWTCVEFHVNGQTDDAETYYNGVLDEFTQVTKGDPIPGSSGCLAGSGTGWNLPNPQTIRVGFAMAHQLDNPATMWMDDIVVSDKRVGCPK